MTWFKVDDGLHSHRKVLSIPRKDRGAAMGLWVLAGSWSADNLTDGHIPAYMVSELGSTPKAARSLVSAQLWIETGDGYEFHQWSQPGRQPTRAEVEADREAERIRKSEYRERVKSQRDKAGTPSGTPNGTGTDVPAGVRTTRPDPTRPVLSSGLGSQSPNGHTPARQSDGPNLAKIAAHLGSDERWAQRVVTQVLDRAPSDVRDPTAYVLRAIDERPADYRPTPTAPGIRQLCIHSREAATCPWADEHEASA